MTFVFDYSWEKPRTWHTLQNVQCKFVLNIILVYLAPWNVGLKKTCLSTKFRCKYIRIYVRIQCILLTRVVTTLMKQTELVLSLLSDAAGSFMYCNDKELCFVGCMSIFLTPMLNTCLNTALVHGTLLYAQTTLKKHVLGSMCLVLWKHVIVNGIENCVTITMSQHKAPNYLMI